MFLATFNLIFSNRYIDLQPNYWNGAACLVLMCFNAVFKTFHWHLYLNLLRQKYQWHTTDTTNLPYILLNPEPLNKDKPGTARNSQQHQGKARNSQWQSGTAKKARNSQGQPGTYRNIHEHPATARDSQEHPWTSRKSQYHPVTAPHTFLHAWFLLHVKENGKW